MTLPGVGSYTARAIACFAYQQAVPVVDTNVRRVVARVVHGRADAAGRHGPRLMPTSPRCCPMTTTAHTFSAALMELGATVCTARTPQLWRCARSACAVAARWFSAIGKARPAVRRATPEPTDRFAVDYWTCCAATTCRLPAISSMSSGCATPCSATGRWTRYLPTAWWSRPVTADSRSPAKKASSPSRRILRPGGTPAAPHRAPGVRHLGRVNMLRGNRSLSSTASGRPGATELPASMSNAGERTACHCAQ